MGTLLTKTLMVFLDVSWQVVASHVLSASWALHFKTQMDNLHVCRELRGGNLLLTFWTLFPVTSMLLLHMSLEALCVE